jgi:hypothetical protein
LELESQTIHLLDFGCRRTLKGDGGGMYCFPFVVLEVGAIFIVGRIADSSIEEAQNKHRISTIIKG